MQNLPAPSTKSYAEIKANKKMRWWYEHLADFMIAHPQALQNDIAAHFGRSPSTISTIINSDAFQAYLRQRRANYVGALDDTVRRKMLEVTDKGFDLILDRFDKKRDSIPLETLAKTLEVVGKVGARDQNHGGGVNVTVNAPPNGQPSFVAVPVSLADLQEAQQALRNAQLGRTPAPIVEAEYTELQPDAEDLK